MFKRQVVAELCRAFADFIHEAPAAAEWTARKMAAVLERLSPDPVDAADSVTPAL